MRELIRKILMMMICIPLVGCGIGSSENKKAKLSMGRYVEETSEVEKFIKKGGEVRLWLNDQGNLEALIHNDEFENYELADSGEWKRTESKLCDTINKKYPEIESIENIAYGEVKDSYYLYGYKKESEPFIAVFNDNELNEIKLEGYKETPYIFNGELTNQKGQLVYFNSLKNYIQVFNNKGKLQVELKCDEAARSIMLDNKIIAMGTNKVDIYDVNTYAKEKSIGNINCTYYEDCMFSDNKDTIYIASSDGVIRINKEGSIAEKIIDGDLCALSSYAVKQGIIYKDEIYMIYSERDKLSNEQFKVKKYTYHKDVPTVPSEKLSIWAVKSSTVLKNAVTEYKKNHPDTYVKVETLYTDEQYYEQNGVINAEDLEPLSTQLLAGEGPDLTILDRLPIEAYRKQGLFTDLTECVERSNQKGALLKNVVKSYSEDGKVYAVPLEFSLILAIGEKEFLKDGFNLQEIAVYQENHKDERVMFPADGAERVQVMADLWQSNIFTADGKLDTKVMADYLKTTKSIIEDDKNAGWCSDWRESFDTQGTLLNHVLKVDINKSNNLGDLQAIAAELAQAPNCMVTDKIEQQENLIQAQQIIAINKNSKKQQQAEEFIEIALSDKVQGNDDEGFPVNEEILTDQLLYNNHSKEKGGDNMVYYNKWLYDESNRLIWSGERNKFGYEKEMKFFLEKCKTGKVQKSIDEVVRNIIREEAEGYFKGNVALEEAVSNIEKKVNLYVMEQSR